MFFGGGLELQRLVVGKREGFVEDDEFSALEGEYRLFDVASAPSGDGNEVDFRIGGESFEVGVTAHFADALRQIFDAFGHDVADGGDGELVLELQQFRDVHEAPGASHSGDTDFDDL